MIFSARCRALQWYTLRKTFLSSASTCVVDTCTRVQTWGHWHLCLSRWYLRLRALLWAMIYYPDNVSTLHLSLRVDTCTWFWIWGHCDLYLADDIFGWPFAFKWYTLPITFRSFIYVCVSIQALEFGNSALTFAPRPMIYSPEDISFLCLYFCGRYMHLCSNLRALEFVPFPIISSSQRLALSNDTLSQ